MKRLIIVIALIGGAWGVGRCVSGQPYDVEDADCFTDECLHRKCMEDNPTWSAERCEEYIFETECELDQAFNCIEEQK